MFNSTPCSKNAYLLVFELLCQKLTFLVILARKILRKFNMKILQICPPHLSDVDTLPCGIQKKSFSIVLFIHASDNLLSQKKTNSNLLANPTWKCHYTKLWIAKRFHQTEVLLRSFKRWGLWKEAVVGYCWRPWKEPTVMCGNWNIRQELLQQVFRVTTFCVNTCFRSFSTHVSRIVHHAVLKFSSCRNKPLPQASTCPYQYTRSSYMYSVPQTQY